MSGITKTIKRQWIPAGETLRFTSNTTLLVTGDIGANVNIEVKGSAVLALHVRGNIGKHFHYVAMQSIGSTVRCDGCTDSNATFHMTHTHLTLNSANPHFLINAMDGKISLRNVPHTDYMVVVDQARLEINGTVVNQLSMGYGYYAFPSRGSLPETRGDRDSRSFIPRYNQRIDSGIDGYSTSTRHAPIKYPGSRIPRMILK